MFERDGATIKLVVTDVGMPRMRGDEFASRLAEQRAHVPLIFMSGHDSVIHP